MFRHSSSPTSAPSYSDDFMQHAAASFSAAVPTQIPGAVAGYLDGSNVVGTFPPFAASASPPPPSYSYSSSLPSSYYNIHRSISSHSLPLHLQFADLLNGGSAFFSSSSPSPHQLPLPPLSYSGDLFEFTSSCPVRRVFSTGDLQGMNGSSPPRPLPSGDSCGQDGGGPFSQKVGRYSAEERKERIERYRVKRNQRNFNKKITYACRKTLADSRSRVKGRFARNGEAFDNSYNYCGYSDPSNHGGGGNSCYHGAQYNNIGEWWWRVPGATAAAADDAERQRQQVGFDVDEELWATLGDMLSVNLDS